VGADLDGVHSGGKGGWVLPVNRYADMNVLARNVQQVTSLLRCGRVSHAKRL
jgi:hypothetical protein